MNILSFDLGDFKRASAWHFKNHDTQATQIGMVSTEGAELTALLQRLQPDCVLCEACTMTYLLYDVVTEVLPQAQFVAANTNAEAWRWSKAKRKTDQTDAERLDRLFVLNELESVFLPDQEIRNVRRLISYRTSLVNKRTACYNAIRHTCKQHQLTLPSGEAAWSTKALNALQISLRELTEGIDLRADNMWCIEVLQIIAQLNLLNQHIAETEQHIQSFALKRPETQRLQQIHGIGVIVSVALVAYIGDAKRFKKGKHIASYAGLVPRVYQSGESCRHGRITKCGNRHLRKLMINAAWHAVRGDPWAKQLFERLTGGSQHKTRRKIAIVAVARRLLIRCWAMMRDGTPWQSSQDLHAQAA